MSGFELDVKLDVDEVKKAFSYLQNEAIDKAAARSLNRAAQKVNSISKRSIAKQIGLPQKAFKEQVKITAKANQNKLYAVVEAKGKHINLIEFVAPSKRVRGAFKKQAGVVTKQYGKKVIVKGAFIGKGKNSGKVLVLQRAEASDNKSKVVGKFGPSIPKTFIQKEIIKVMQKEAGITWQKEFAHNIRYYIGLIK